MTLLAIACPAMAADFYPETLTLICYQKTQKTETKKLQTSPVSQHMSCGQKPGLQTLLFLSQAMHS